MSKDSVRWLQGLFKLVAAIFFRSPSDPMDTF